ncbi:MAG TPA: cell envelope integrity protein CreD [Puia sp.]|jgi:inner membrane protein
MENTLTTLWNKNKIILKSFLIGLLILLLLIPTLFIQGLVAERKQRQGEAVTEISSRWAGSQTVVGPVIGIPYTETITEDNSSHEQKKWAYFLPGRLSIKAHLVPEVRYRGIYQAIVYTTELQIHGSYDSLSFGELNIPRERLLWSEAAVFFDVSDVQGLKEDMVLHLAAGNGAIPGAPGAATARGAGSATPAAGANPSPNTGFSSDLSLIPAKFTTDQFKSALSATLPSWLAANNGPIEFSATVSLKGTGNLLFVPIGRETKAEASSSWSNPSFTGSVLPDLRTVKDSGFDANWKVLALNRKYPQQWKQGVYDLNSSAFGVDLIVPVDAYQQTTRSVKYAILIIVLTFTAFFLIEWIYGRPIHSLQYLLVGFALCVFYTLLLSLSEYAGFNAAYGLAAAATIGLIGWYVGSMLRSSKMSMFIIFLLVVQYGFVFTLIQLQDYALLMGSLGLFITLALVMYFSRKIKWNN